MKKNLKVYIFFLHLSYKLFIIYVIVKNLIKLYLMIIKSIGIQNIVYKYNFFQIFLLSIYVGENLK